MDTPVHLCISNEKFKLHLVKLIKYLSSNGISFYWNYKFNLKKSLSKANVGNAKFVIIIGEDEYKKDSYSIKNLNSGNQTIAKIDNILNRLNDKS